MIRHFIRLLSVTLFVAGVVAVALPARADDYTGAYSCMTRTGIRLEAIIIQNGDEIAGTYVGHNGIPGHLNGSVDDNGVLTYQWFQKRDEGQNMRDDGGWGRMTFLGSTVITGMKAAWGRPNDAGPVGFWTCGPPL
jgi:hypothetical protein